MFNGKQRNAMFSRETFTIYLSKSCIFPSKSVYLVLLFTKVGHRTHLTHRQILEKTV